MEELRLDQDAVDRLMAAVVMQACRDYYRLCEPFDGDDRGFRGSKSPASEYWETRIMRQRDFADSEREALEEFFLSERFKLFCSKRSGAEFIKRIRELKKKGGVHL